MTPLVTDDTTVGELAALLRDRRALTICGWRGGYRRSWMWRVCESSPTEDEYAAVADRPTLAAALSALLEALPEVSP